ncbi:response regulator [bacterium]|nr:response regulator [bacterium]
MWIRPDNTLLLVEPDSFIRRCLVGALQQAGYRVLQASDGPEALQLIRQNPRVRMVISEVLLPSSPATSFLRELRRLRRDLPVLFTTGVNPRLLTQPLPQRDILNKPFSPDMLVERVGRQLRGQGPAPTKLAAPRARSTQQSKQP